MTNEEKMIDQEIKAIEEIMSKEKSLNKISFYEGYIKGLKIFGNEMKNAISQATHTAKIELLESLPIKKKHQAIYGWDNLGAFEGYNQAKDELIEWRDKLLKQIKENK